jgi:hypothetical protein
VLYWQPWNDWLVAFWEIKDGKATLADDYDGEMPGLEPPQWVKDVREAAILSSRAELYSDEYTRQSIRFYDIHAEQCLIVGTVGLSPVPVIYRSNLKNVPDSNPPDKGHLSLNKRAMQLFYD